MFEIRPVPEMQQVYDYIYKNSPTFRASVDEIVKHGNVTFRITAGNRSYYDGATRTIELGTNTGEGELHQRSLAARNESDLVFELMNAYWEDVQPLGSIGSHGNAEDYGKAREKHEWQGVRRHCDIMKALEKVDPKFCFLNRFSSAFETLDPSRSWTNFDNYYNYQLATGHTKYYHDDFERYRAREREAVEGLMMLGQPVAK